MSKTSEYYPTFKNGKWYASYKYKSDFSSRTQEREFKDWNGDELEFDDEESTKSWCVTKNEIDKIL